MVLKIYKNSENIIIKILHLINVFIVLFSFYIGFITNKYYLIFISIAYVLSFEMVIHINDAICVQIFTVYMQIVGPLEMLVGEVSKVSVFGPGRMLGYAYLLDSKELHYKYFALSLGFYIVLLIFFSVFNHIANGIKLNTINFARINMGRASVFSRIGLLKYAILLGYGFLEYYIRISFSLDVPGKIPTIPFAGWVVYSYGFIHQYLAFLCLKDFYYKNKISVGNIINIIFMYILLSVPDLLLDRRGPMLYLAVIAFLHIYFVKNEEFNSFVKKHFGFMVTLVVAFLYAFAKFSEMVRYKGLVKLPITFFLYRMIGVADGFFCLNYINQGGLSQFQFYHLGDLFRNIAANGAGASINYVYTRAIEGYPTNVVHSDCVPVFVGSLMYSGYKGFFAVAVIFSLLFVLSDRLIKQGLYVKEPNSLLIYIGCYLAIKSVNLIMGGAPEKIIEIFVLPIMLYLFSLFTKNDV